MSIAEFPSRPDPPSPEIAQKPDIGFGIYLPKKFITNEQIEQLGLKTQSGKLLTAEVIKGKTGIEKRYVANEEETPLFMGLNAAQQVLNGKKVDAVIVSTSFPVGYNLSARIRDELGLYYGFNIDIHAACSGFTRGLSFIKEHERKFNGKRILFIATEKYSPYLCDLRNGGISSDPSLAQTIFSDGAVAVMLEYGKDLEVLSKLEFNFPKETENYIKMPIDRSLLVSPFLEIPVPYPSSGKFEQNGKEVFESIRSNIKGLVEQAILEAGFNPPDIKKIFAHQGSGYLIRAIHHNMRDYAVYYDFEEGNFSSASIPKALMKAVNQGEIKRGDNLVLAGFGAGLFASIAVVRLN